MFAVGSFELDGYHAPVLRFVESATSSPTYRAARDETMQWLSDLALRISAATPADECPCVIVDLQDINFMDDGGSGLPISILRQTRTQYSFVVAFVGTGGYLDTLFELLRFDKHLLRYLDPTTAMREIRQYPQPESEEEYGKIMDQLLAGAESIRKISARHASSSEGRAPRSDPPSPPRKPIIQPVPPLWKRTFPNSAEAKRVLDDLTVRGALHGFGAPETENTLYRILHTFEANEDWHLALEILTGLTNFHSAQNDLLEMAERCRDGLKIAERVGDEKSIRFFRNCLIMANRREEQAVLWQFALLCLLLVGVIAVGCAVLIWGIGFVRRQLGG